ncbi:MAG: type III pantothenate kinase [Clostridiales bacterium]|nr:type III pantothenate kinase [Clostridiales bacterium]
MILAVDIGNSTIVIGVMKNDGKAVFNSRIKTDIFRTADQYAIGIKNILELYGTDKAKIDGSIISSVVPPVLNAVKYAIKIVTGINPIVVGPGVKTGLNILMDDPGQVGSDRIVTAVAALNIYKPPMIIIDMGTATTIEVVDKNKNYIGGCICPGVKTSLDALSSKTAQLPSISLEKPKRVLGKNTVECMRSGIIYGSAAMIDGLISYFEEELSETSTRVATGGFSAQIVPFCRNKIHISENLLMEGLYLIYRRNMK